jgi:DNA-binding NarL/FixJ family response regulator
MIRTSPLRVVVADNQPLFREGVRRLFETEKGILVVGDMADDEDAVERCTRLQPNVLLLGPRTPRLSGREALGRLRKLAPRTAVVFLMVEVHDVRDQRLAEVVEDSSTPVAQAPGLASNAGTSLAPSSSASQGSA